MRVCIWMFDLNFYFVWDQKQNALKNSGGVKKWETRKESLGGLNANGVEVVTGQ